MVEPGTRIDTSIPLKIVRDGEEQAVALADLLDRPTIVSVYMKNNTSSCDKQTHSLAEHAGWFEERGVRLIGLSKDTCGSHKRYAVKQGLSYILASDPDNLFSKATDSIVEKSMYGKTYLAPSRSAFYLDTDGTVLGVIEKVDPKNHAEQVMALVQPKEG